MDVEEAKRNLHAILTAARLRREGIEQHEAHAPAVVEPHTPRPEPQPQPVAQDVQGEVVPVPELEPTPETHPELFIEVRTPELIRLGRDAGNDQGIEVLSGKMIITYRRRLPTDGDEPFVLVPPKPERNHHVEEPIYWPSWGEPGPKIDPRLSGKYDKPQRGWSLGRNAGCTMADGSIHP